jgi:hypothetical protein
VTLTIMNVAPWGVWTCSDHRLTPLDGQGEPTDMSVKQIILRSADGEALITYSGMGTVEDDVHLSEWLRRLLRNENWNLDQIQLLIRNWATAKWGATLCARGRPHWFLVGGFSHGCPLGRRNHQQPWAPRVVAAPPLRDQAVPGRHGAAALGPRGRAGGDMRRRLATPRADEEPPAAEDQELDAGPCCRPSTGPTLGPSRKRDGQ